VFSKIKAKKRIEENNWKTLKISRPKRKIKANQSTHETHTWNCRRLRRKKQKGINKRKQKDGGFCFSVLFCFWVCWFSCFCRIIIVVVGFFFILLLVLKWKADESRKTKQKRKKKPKQLGQQQHRSFTSHSHRKNKRKESHLLKCFFIVCLFIIIVVERTLTDAFAALCYLFCFSHLTFPLCFVYFLWVRFGYHLIKIKSA
jgi:Flp pilus assembly protein TadB